jgi:hypothetical protein
MKVMIWCLVSNSHKISHLLSWTLYKLLPVKVATWIEIALHEANPIEHIREYGEQIEQI